MKPWFTLFIPAISTPRSGLRRRLRFLFLNFVARLITNVENLQDLSQTNMIYDEESDAMHVYLNGLGKIMVEP